MKLKEEKLDLRIALKDEMEKDYEAKIDKVKMEWMEKNQVLKNKIEGLQSEIKHSKTLFDQNNQVRNSVKPYNQEGSAEDKALFMKENEKLQSLLKEKEALIE